MTPPSPPTWLPASRQSHLVAISPHLDDAVLSCGDLLAAHPGAVVVTAFAGHPGAYPELTSWDARAGFTPGADVVAARREEDRQALATLGARPHWLDLPDPQYGQRPALDALAAALTGALAQIPDGPHRPASRDTHPPAPITTLVFPLGLFHDDHILTGDAVLLLARQGGWPGVTWIAYADAIYRRVPPLLDERLAALGGAGLDLAALDAPARPASELKRRAVGCYRSQLRALDASWDGGYSDAFQPEQYWRLTLPSPHRPGTPARGQEAPQ